MKYGELEVVSPRARLKGRVERIQIIDATSGLIMQELKGFDNLVLNSGLDLAASYSYAELFRFCAVGTGNAVPAITQTTLQAEAARTSAMFTGVGNCGTTQINAYTFTMKRTHDFAAGTLSGNYTEIGWSPLGGASSNLFSRVLIEVGGVPTAITVTSTQVLRIVYSLTISFGPINAVAINANFGGGWGAVTGNALLQSVSTQISNVNTAGITNFVSGSNLEGTSNMYAFVSQSSAALAAVGGFVARDAVANTHKSGTVAAYVAGTYQRDKSVQFNVSEANQAIQSFGVGQPNNGTYGAHGFAVVMNAPKTKLSTNTLTFNYRMSWGR